MDLSPKTAFILASSGDIYGLSFNRGQPLGEDELLVPANPYSAAKAAADLAVGEMSLRGLQAIRLRLFNHTGARQSARFALPNFARQVTSIAASRVEPVITTGNLDRWRDVLDVKDVISAYLATLEWNGPFDGRIFNVCSGTSRHMRAVLEDMIDRAGIRAQIVEQPMHRGTQDVPFSSGTPELFANTFGWSPRVAWSRTIEDLLAYWRRRADQMLQ